MVDAVLTFNPDVIRKVGAECGHPVRLANDLDVAVAAAEMTLMYIPTATDQQKNMAFMILTGVGFSGF